MSSASDLTDSPTSNASTASQISKLSHSPAGSEISTNLTVLIVGGGTAGVVAGISLASTGADVHIYEQEGFSPQTSSSEVGILITEELQQFLSAYKIVLSESDRARITGRQVLSHEGEVQLQDSTEQEYVSRESLHSALLQAFPSANYHRNCKVVGVETSYPDIVVLELETEERIAGHMVVAADGVSSTVREQLLPQCQPTYAGYLAWRGVAQLNRLSPEAQYLLAEKGSMYKGANLHMLVHPLPAMDVGTSSDGLPLAWTWFNNQVQEELPGLLLDHNLKVYPQAVPFGRLSPAVADAVAAAATQVLPPPFAELVAASNSHMAVAAVSDMALTSQTVGKVAFIGQAGCVFRPHGCSPIHKAVQDATSLAEVLKIKKMTVEKALSIWDVQQSRQGLAMCSRAAAAGNRLQGTGQQ